MGTTNKRWAKLAMAFLKPSDGTEHFRDIVYPENTDKLNLQMLPAARVDARLIDPDGKPLAKYNVDIEGDSFPATSVVRARRQP